MSFAWPFALAALLLLPALVAVWWLTRRRRRRNAVVIPSVRAVRAAVATQSRARRWVPASLLALGIVAASAAVARPQTTVDVATSEATIMLAIDVSSSMCSTDVDPNRIEAAQEAAIEFVESQDESVAIGIVAFSSSASLVSEPTTDRDELIDAIGSLTTSRGTAIGQSILTSIDAIAQVDSDVASTGVEVTEDEDDSDDDSYAAETIVVLTDGTNSAGVEPVTAAEEAAARGLRVYTIGFGTDEASPAVCDSSQVDSGDMAMSGGGGGPSQTLDEATLQEVADLTGGEYFAAEDASELADVLTGLDEVVAVQQEQQDIGAWFAGAAGLLVTAAVGLSLWWSRSRVRV
ncbi:VWA domain-containing protein [Demequina salsinemoris]|uniref:VWA domain-containing protein n=1 Tax=Demequina salsinemoris TaxID=577470 RepID=UPI0007867DE5|nr:VWA domain-containing protein [Demequina salsinemoris]